MKKEKESKPIMVKVEGKKYETRIDLRGVQRFKENSVINFLVDKEIIDLNKLAIAFQEKEFTKRDFAEFNMMLGYSVCGFAELSFFEDYEIDNPLWNKKK